MQITLLLFAMHRETVGQNRLTIQLPEGSTTGALYDCLVLRYPGLEALRPYTTYALNREVVGPEATLRDGDEVALLQPVSGGCDD